MKKIHPWALGILLFLVGFTVLVVVAGVMISRQHYQLVRTDYYTHEIEYEDFLNAIRRVEALPEKPVMELIPASRILSVQMPTNLLSKVSDAKLHLYYPADQHQDQHHKVNFDAMGTFVIPYPPEASGNWKFELQWTMDDQIHVQGKRIFL